MKYKDMAVFKSPTRIDWDATLDKIVEMISKEHPEYDALNFVMVSADTFFDFKKWIRNVGVKYLYKYLHEGEQ